MSRRRSQPLGERASIVFERHFSGNAAELHPDDRAEAEAFVGWLDRFERPAEPDRRRTPQVYAAALSVAVLAVILVSGLLLFGWRAPVRPADEAFVTYAAGHAENRRVTLRDGSILDLGAETRVDVAYSSGERRLILRSGEALFTVAHNAQRPFIVSAANGEVRAIGTAFNIRVGGRGAEVAIIDGVVRVDASDAGDNGSGRQAIVHSGQQVDYGLTSSQGALTTYLTAPRDIERDDVIAWRRGLLVFRGAPLAEVISVANRYAAHPIRLRDVSKATLPVFGIFKVGETAELQALAGP